MKHVSQLEPGDEFGPIARDPHGILNVISIRHAGLRGYGGGVRNLWDVEDQFGRVWRTGGRRLANDCYGWSLMNVEIEV